MRRVFAVLACLALVALPAPSFARDDGAHVLSVDHYVTHASTAPPIAGQQVQLYMRERVQAQMVTHSPSFGGNVVLFVHGAWGGSSGEFDAPYQDYSWMAYLAQNGFDAFALDLTGYGYSSRPEPMNDPCNTAADVRPLINPAALSGNCTASMSTQINSIQSELDDLDAAVDYVRNVRHVDRVHLGGWSLGGSRVGGYAALHPEKVGRLVLLAPTYDADHPTMSAPQTPDSGPPVTLISRAGLLGNWDRQVQCDNQFDPGFRDAMWAEALQADGIAWAPDQRRVPPAPAFRWNRAIAAQVRASTLIVEGELDQMTPSSLPAAVHAAYMDLGTAKKVFLSIPCASHFALWETAHTQLFQASQEWLRDGTVNGQREGEMRADAGAN